MRVRLRVGVRVRVRVRVRGFGARIRVRVRGFWVRVRVRVRVRGRVAGHMPGESLCQHGHAMDGHVLRLAAQPLGAKVVEGEDLLRVRVRFGGSLGLG